MSDSVNDNCFGNANIQLDCMFCEVMKIVHVERYKVEMNFQFRVIDNGLKNANITHNCSNKHFNQSATSV